MISTNKHLSYIRTNQFLVTFMKLLITEVWINATIRGEDINNLSIVYYKSIPKDNINKWNYILNCIVWMTGALNPYIKDMCRYYDRLSLYRNIFFLVFSYIWYDFTPWIVTLLFTISYLYSYGQKEDIPSLKM